MPGSGRRRECQADERTGCQARRRRRLPSVDRERRRRDHDPAGRSHRLRQRVRRDDARARGARAGRRRSGHASVRGRPPAAGRFVRCGGLRPRPRGLQRIPPGAARRARAPPGRHVPAQRLGRPARPAVRAARHLATARDHGGAARQRAALPDDGGVARRRRDDLRHGDPPEGRQRSGRTPAAHALRPDAQVRGARLAADRRRWQRHPGRGRPGGRRAAHGRAAC